MSHKSGTFFLLFLVLFISQCVFAPAEINLNSDVEFIENKTLSQNGLDYVNMNLADSYSAGGKCYCESAFDHEIGDFVFSTPAGQKTIRQICNKIGAGPSLNRIYYNDIQCGNGPPNNAGDEDWCPGRVDKKWSCGVKGPKWDLSIFDNNICGNNVCETNEICNQDCNQDQDLKKIVLPEGFLIDYYVKNIDNARSLRLTPSGVLFVGTRNAGKVYAVLDNNKDFKADEVIVIAKNLNNPNGVAYKDGALYVAEISRILKFENIENELNNVLDPIVIFDDFPNDKSHGWKYINFGPDEKLYVPVGAPCNICNPNDPYATITRMDSDGTNFEIYVRGIRNTVGFAWHPISNKMWFTDNGRDWLGDNRPPDELNMINGQGDDFGYPYCHGIKIEDPDYGSDCDNFIAPKQELGPHVAALGMEFYVGNSFPQEYHNQIFIAEHGSWNRKDPIGYRITLVRLNGEQATSYEVFAQGWLQNRESFGRPVDIELLNDGSMLVSDDFNDAIYRIWYAK